MADRLMRAQVTVALDSQIPDDAIVNTFYFDQDDNGLLPTPDASYDAVVASLEQFYSTIENIFPSTVANTVNVRIYDMRDAQPRQVRRQDSFTITPSASGPLPSEVALVMGFAADYESGVNPARRRGRIYLGPIATTMIQQVGSQAMFTTDRLDDIMTGANGLLVPNDVGGSSLSWAMYSPTTDAAGANIDDSFFDVQRAWVDNAFDTQRRRGATATTRLTTTGP